MSRISQLNQKKCAYCGKTTNFKKKTKLVVIVNQDNDKDDVDLPTEVIDRVNVGVIAVSLSLYEEGMDLEELIEVTGISREDVSKCLEYLIDDRMVRKKIGSDTYRVSNFKKMLQFLLSEGMVFPLGDQFTKLQEDKND